MAVPILSQITRYETMLKSLGLRPRDFNIVTYLCIYEIKLKHLSFSLYILKVREHERKRIERKRENVHASWQAYITGVDIECYSSITVLVIMAISR